MKYLVVLVLTLILFVGCTEQHMANQFGGKTTVEVPANKKFMNITWKTPNGLWILTRDRKPGDTKETYNFTESSSWGIFEGTVVIVEK
jgi:hypothetical protein